MKAKWVVVGILTLVLVGLGNGCVENDKSLVIVYNVAPDDQCKYSVQTGANAIFISGGNLDLSLSPVYLMEAQIENYMPNNLNAVEKDINTLDVQIEGAEITYKWLDGRDIIASYPELMALESQAPFIDYHGATVSAADTTGEPGKVVMGIFLFSSQVGDLISGAGLSADDLSSIVLQARIRVFGHTLGGISIRSNTFMYPISFCDGCFNGAVCCPGTDKETAMQFCLIGQPAHLSCSC